MHIQELDLKTVLLQRYPQYLEETVTLLNNQWPRSRTARLRSLEQGSKDSLPTSLVLVLTDSLGKESVVAHSKVSPVPYKPQLCFVESVVVSPEFRGLGLGRHIMDSTEFYAKSLGVTTVYLTTLDQQGFYSKLGYVNCDPIVVFGGSRLLTEKIDKCKDFSYVHTSSSSTSENEKKKSPQLMHQQVEAAPTPSTPTTVPPAPPPPPRPNFNGTNPANNINSKLTMKKELHVNVAS